jgi:hypothetical protein
LQSLYAGCSLASKPQANRRAAHRGRNSIAPVLPEPREDSQGFPATSLGPRCVIAIKRISY